MSQKVCAKCGNEVRFLTVRKQGKNHGRPFARCECSFYWLDTQREEELPIVSEEEFIERHGRVKSDFVPSKYQQAIFDWVKNWDGSNALVVEALAGSGKTTTGVEMLKLLPEGIDAIFVAFNKHIATELVKRVPRGVQVRTYHALGFAGVRETYGNVRVDGRKIRYILEDVLNKDIHGHLFGKVSQIVSLVKANLTGTSDEELMEIVDYHGIELNGDEYVIFEAVRAVIARSAKDTNTIDFDDMCWMPVYFDLPMKKYDLVFIDEAQDTNKAQIALALKSVKEGGKIIAVGDRYQSLYGFRGADADAIPNLIESLDAEVLPLSITYRNPRKVVELCNNVFPNIPLEAWDNAQEGEVKSVLKHDFIANAQAGDMVLCRTNAPLVEPCFALIRAGKKATIRGRDIGKNLRDLIQKTVKQKKVATLTDLLHELNEYCRKEVAKLLAAEKNSQAQAIEDKVDTIIALADGLDSIFDLETRIDAIFSDEIEGVVFSTVHRAKGLESDVVYILRSDLLPHPMAKKDWELEQERNIEYVAYTRTRRILAIVM